MCGRMGRYWLARGGGIGDRVGHAGAHDQKTERVGDFCYVGADAWTKEPITLLRVILVYDTLVYEKRVPLARGVKGWMGAHHTSL